MELRLRPARKGVTQARATHLHICTHAQSAHGSVVQVPPATPSFASHGIGRRVPERP